MKILPAALALTLTAAAWAQSPPQPATPTPDPLLKVLLGNTSTLFGAFQHRDVIAFMSGVTADFTYVGPEGVLATEDLAGVVQGCGMGTYTITEPQLHVLTPDSAVLVYHHHQEATCNGKRLPAEMLGSDSYVRKSGRWLISVHTETVPQ